MKRIAIFVDAGYLYAQGSACLQGSKAKRENVKLDHSKFIILLKEIAASLSSAPLLRIYWYDGTSRGPTLDHRTLADLDDLKLRLGFINSVGQQKGVDSLLVTDLVELSRNGAICDAILLGGDEDLRIGVQIAQSFGVRLHLLGIEPARGSQSLQLREEADTKQEISSVRVQTFLSLVTPTPIPQSTIIVPALNTTPNSVTIASTPSIQTGLEAALDTGIDSVLVRWGTAEISALQNAIANSTAIPALYDRPLLASCRTAIGHDLDMNEKKVMRARFIAKVRSLQQP
jgi:uncharacterized LabA/DUF88 family protein